MILANITDAIRAIDSLDRLIADGKFTLRDVDRERTFTPTAIKNVELSDENGKVEINMNFSPRGYARIESSPSGNLQNWHFYTTGSYYTTN